MMPAPHGVGHQEEIDKAKEAKVHPEAVKPDDKGGDTKVVPGPSAPAKKDAAPNKDIPGPAAPALPKSMPSTDAGEPAKVRAVSFQSMLCDWGDVFCCEHSSWGLDAGAEDYHPAAL